MKKIKKQTIGIVLLVMVMITSMIPCESVAAAAKPAKLGKADFQYKTGSYNYNLVDSWNSMGYTWNYLECNRENPQEEKIRTKRGITINSTASAVVKKYGKTAKNKINTKDSFYQHFAYEEQQYMPNTVKNWSYYYEYTYKNGGTYNLRFYIDKKNKVAEIVYLKNISKWKCTTKKKIQPKFQLPEGKKTSTKKIGGKKVTMIPKGTKLTLNKSMLKKPYNAYSFWICQYDKNGTVIAKTNNIYGYSRVSTTNVIDLENEIQNHCFLWDAKKRAHKITKRGDRVWYVDNPKFDALAKDTYFAIGVDHVMEYDPDGYDGGESHLDAVTDFAPEVLYFQYQ
ncbi:MAG: hypothetical protein ACI4HI_13995 [Lachnospiraceae bacterium]